MSERPGQPPAPPPPPPPLRHNDGEPTPPRSQTTRTLVSADGVSFTSVPVAVASLALALVPALESGGTTIPVPGVRARPLALALDYLSAAQAAQAAEVGRRRPHQPRTRRAGARAESDPTAQHTAWAAAWAASLPGPDVAAVAAAASYLDAPALLDLAVSSLASRLRRARPPAELRAAFGLPDDLSPAEAAAVAADCAGALDAAGW